MPKFSTLMGRFLSEAPEETGNNEPRNNNNSNALPADDAKPAWQEMVDKYLRTGRLPPADRLHEIHAVYMADQAEPLDVVRSKIEEHYQTITLRYLKHRADLPEVFAQLPATPFELSFYEKGGTS